MKNDKYFERIYFDISHTHNIIKTRGYSFVLWNMIRGVTYQGNPTTFMTFLLEN